MKNILAIEIQISKNTHKVFVTSDRRIIVCQNGSTIDELFSPVQKIEDFNFTSIMIPYRFMFYGDTAITSKKEIGIAYTTDGNEYWCTFSANLSEVSGEYEIYGTLERNNEPIPDFIKLTEGRKPFHVSVK